MMRNSAGYLAQSRPAGAGWRRGGLRDRLLL